MDRGCVPEAGGFAGRLCRRQRGRVYIRNGRGSTSWLSSAVVLATGQGMRALPGHPVQGAGRPGFSGHAGVQEASTASMRSAQSWDTPGVAFPGRSSQRGSGGGVVPGGRPGQAGVWTLPIAHLSLLHRLIAAID